VVCREDQALLQSLVSGSRLGSARRELVILLEPVGGGWCHPTLRGHTGSFRDPWQNDGGTVS